MREGYTSQAKKALAYAVKTAENVDITTWEPNTF